jgi:iron complex outermembrane receptor protein
VLLPAGSLAAQAPDTLRQDTVYDIEPIAVRAVRPSATTGGVSAITVRLDSVRFRPAPLLEDVLRELPLVQVRTNSRGEAQLALRGAEERQIAVLLDGVPLTLGWDHRTDLSVIPMTAAQSVELVRGMSSVLHGPNVLGGVVEIGMGSVPVVRAEPLQFSAGIDDDGGYSLGVLSTAEVESRSSRLVVRGGVGRRERDGFAAPDDVDAVYPALSGGDLRANSDLEHTDGFLSARYARRGGAWVSATVSGFQAERGVPPELTDDGPRLWRYPESSRVVGVLAGGLDGMENDLGRARLDVNVGIDVGSTRIEDYALPADPADPARDADDFFGTVAETEESDDRTLTVRVTGTQAVGAASLRAAATVADIRHDEVITRGLDTGEPDRTPGEYGQRLWSLAAETELPFTVGVGPLNGGRVSAGIAYDGADTPEAGPDVEDAGPTLTEWGGRLGVSASTSGGGLLFHAAVSRRGRFPALREMYSSALGRFEPNPDLDPEILTAVEAGFTSRFGSYDLQVVGFHQRLDDAIVRGAPPATSDARYMRVNRDRVRSTGLEVLAGYAVGRLALETEFTLQSVEVVEPGSEGVRAEYEPELAGGIGGTAPLIAGIEVGAEVEYWGEQFCSTPSPGEEDYATLEPSTRTDVQLARTFRLGRSVASFQRLGVELAVDNLTDSTVYDQCGLPQPGRALRLQVRVN